MSHKVRSNYRSVGLTLRGVRTRPRGNRFNHNHSPSPAVRGVSSRQARRNHLVDDAWLKATSSSARQHARSITEMDERFDADEAAFERDSELSMWRSAWAGARLERWLAFLEANGTSTVGFQSNIDDDESVLDAATLQTLHLDWSTKMDDESDLYNVSEDEEGESDNDGPYLDDLDDCASPHVFRGVY